MNPLLIGAIANMAGGAIGNMAGSGDRGAAVDAARSGMDAYQQIQVPDIEKMKLLLQQYASAGTLTPEEQQALSLDQNDQLADVQLDPRLKQAQMDALSFMEKTGQGDLTPSERAQVNNLRRQTEADSQSRLQAMLQQQDSRGVGSSDMALAARMLDAQGSANRAAQSTDDISAAAFQRALQSMSSGAQLAGSMESADYGRQANLAEAERNRELANWQNQQSAENTNVGARNAAQQFNLQNSQSVMNQNTGLNNAQQQHNKQLEQQDFENRMRLAGGIAGQSGQVSNALQNRGNATAGMWQGIGAGVGQVGANMKQEDEFDAFDKMPNDPIKPTAPPKSTGYLGVNTNMGFGKAQPSPLDYFSKDPNKKKSPLGL